MAVWLIKYEVGNKGRPTQQWRRSGPKPGGMSQKVVETWRLSSITDILVCGKDVGATKTNAARKWGIRTMSEEDFLALVGRSRGC